MKIVKSIMMIFLLMLSLNGVFAQLNWVPFEESLPSNAVIGGVEDQRSLAVCRCEYQGGTHPGKVVDQECNIGYGGKMISVKKFEVLINDGLVELDWLKAEGTLPDHAIQGGSENGKPIYIGRAYHEKGTHPGKIFKAGDKYICNIGYDGKEITYTTYEVLVENPSDDNVKRLSHDSRCEYNITDVACIGSLIGTMPKEQQINEGFSLVSSNLKYQTRVSDDGRLVIEEILDKVLCDDGRIIIFEAKETWSNTSEKGDPAKDYYLKFQEDGNLCIYSGQSDFVWCSMSNNREGNHFEITNIGHIEVVNNQGNEVWPD